MYFIGLTAGCDNAAEIIPLKDAVNMSATHGLLEREREGGWKWGFLLKPGTFSCLKSMFMSSFMPSRTVHTCFLLYLLTPFVTHLFVINVPSHTGSPTVLILIMYNWSEDTGGSIINKHQIPTLSRLFISQHWTRWWIKAGALEVTGSLLQGRRW